MAASAAYDLSDWHDKGWRLNNLYWIQDKLSRRVPFRLNPAQQAYLEERHGRDLIVKARQLGFSTVIDVDMLDDAVFTRNFAGLIIAHNLDDARKLFATKIRFPFDNLPDQLRDAMELESESGNALVFGSKDRHNSRIDVATSARSGTIHSLHVSEMGKIAARYPEKAREIQSGAFEAVPLNGKIAVESTAEGAFGAFYNLAKRAKEKQESGTKLTKLDFKLHFHPWWEDDANILPNADVVIDADMEDYFQSLLHNHGIYLAPEQRAWWVKKNEILDEDMKAENPATFEEAFESAIKGAFYSRQLSRARLEKRIGYVAYDPNYPVYTGWDLGMDDSTTIWFAQLYGLHQTRLIDYHEDTGHGIEHYTRIVREKPYIYECHFLPQDSRNRSLTSEIEGEPLEKTARRLGLRPLTVVKRPRNSYELVTREVNIVRRFLARVCIDEKNCAQGIRALGSYQAEWDEKAATFKNAPLHNWASHGADALRTLAKGLQKQHAGLYPSDIQEPEALPNY